MLDTWLAAEPSEERRSAVLAALFQILEDPPSANLRPIDDPARPLARVAVVKDAGVNMTLTLAEQYKAVHLVSITDDREDRR
ncbi:MAG TPA: hypothetical protein VGR26_02315 [Acidimicrobiales bacterium]|nr:hypothetical protein [Acidimicrobiales bacterium]